MKKNTKTIIGVMLGAIICLAVLFTFLKTKNNIPQYKLGKQIQRFYNVASGTDLKDLSLTIYHTSPYDKRLVHWNVDQLIEAINVYGLEITSPNRQLRQDQNAFRIDIDRTNLKDYISEEEYRSLLQQVTPEKIEIAEEPAGITGTLDARIYYVFQYNSIPILEVVMWSCGKGGVHDWDGRWMNIYVNGVEVEADKAFYDVIMPFLPERFADQLEHYITGTLPDYYVDALARD